MNMSRLNGLILIAFNLLAMITFAQTGTIKGKISTSDGKPAEFVNVGLKGSHKGATANNQGHYEIKEVEPGSYTRVTSFIGLVSKELEVIVKAGETTEVGEIVLNESATKLNEVVVNGAVNKFGDKNSELVARLPLKNLENPQVYNVVNKELIKEQVVVNFDDAMKNSAGVNRLWSSTGRGGDGAGYFSMRGFSVQPNIINGVAGQTNGGIDPANIERIEVIKGPSGTLFGSSLVSFGGLMNIVLKKPYETFGGEATYTGGSYGLNRIAADVNTPLNKDNTALFRLNGAAHYEGSFQDAGFKKSMFVAPSFTYKMNDRLSVILQAEYYASEGTNPLMVFLNRSRQLIARTPYELGVNFKRSYTSNDITIKNKTLSLIGQINYKLSDSWTSQTNIASNVRTADGYYSYVMYLQPTNDTLISRYISDQHSISNNIDFQQNFIGDFKIGSFRNRVVIGADALLTKMVNNSTAYIEFDKINTANKKDPRYAQLSRQALDAKLGANTTPAKSGTQSNTYSAYISDVFNISERWMAMASIRFDYFDNIGNKNFALDTITGVYKQTALSPKFGMVYQVIKNHVAVFANYMNGFRNVAPVIQPLSDINGTFKPQQANQAEAGVKLELFQNKVSLTASYYDILVHNMTRSETIIRDNKPYNITVQDASQASKGYEFDLAMNPIPGLNVVAGYSKNISKNLKTAENINGRRPVGAGPEDLANAWISYTLQHGKVRGLGFGAGGNYASENKITNGLITGEFILEAYTIVNAAIFYNANAFRINVKMDNVANKTYFGGWTTVEQQMPRRFMISLAVKF
jgi:iron complex outermembrane recepter protein